MRDFNHYLTNAGKYGKMITRKTATKAPDKQETLQIARVDWYCFAAALTYAVKQEFGKVIENLDRMIRLQPGVAALYYSRGYMYCRQHGFDEAIKDYSKAIRIEPGNTAAYISRGRAYFNKGDLSKAIDDFTRAIRLDPENSRAYIDRRDAYEKNGDRDKADEDDKTFHRIVIDGGYILSQEDVDALLSPRLSDMPDPSQSSILTQEEVNALLNQTVSVESYKY